MLSMLGAKGESFRRFFSHFSEEREKRQTSKGSQNAKKAHKTTRNKTETENKTKRIYEKSIKLTFVPIFFFSPLSRERKEAKKKNA